MLGIGEEGMLFWLLRGRRSGGEFEIESVKKRRVFFSDGRLEFRIEVVGTHGDGGLGVEEERVDLKHNQDHSHNHFISHSYNINNE